MDGMRSGQIGIGASAATCLRDDFARYSSRPKATPSRSTGISRLTPSAPALFVIRSSGLGAACVPSWGANRRLPFSTLTRSWPSSEHPRQPHGDSSARSFVRGLPGTPPDRTVESQRLIGSDPRLGSGLIGGVKFDRRELAGAVADVGVLVPIAVALIVSNGLSATAVLLPAGLLYLLAAFVYGLPIPVQPLKAFGAIAIAKGLGSDEIAAGALLMGVVFVVLGPPRLLDLAARAFPKALIRGVPLTVGLLFLKIAWGLVLDPPKAFAEHALDPALAAALAAGAVILAFSLRRYPVSLVLVLAGVGIMVWLGAGDAALGPSSLSLPSLGWATLGTAFTVLVLPQLPLSFANSCLATADAARV